jgi:hypothetical protein
MNNINTMPSAYIATSDTSKARAIREDVEGVTTERRREILEHVTNAGAMGVIWADISDATGLHHGQVTSALHALHVLGLVAQLTEIRKRCHPYIAAEHIDLYEPHEVQLKPRKSANTYYIELLEELAKAAYDVAYRQSNGEAYNRLRKAIDEVRRHQGLKK